MKTLLKGGKVVSGQKELAADLLLDGSRIEAVGVNLRDDQAELVDISGKYLLPGGIDAHTHISLSPPLNLPLNPAATPGSAPFRQGAIPAVLGGSTCIIEHLAFRPQGYGLKAELADYLALARGRAAVDYTFHGLIQSADRQSLADLEILPRLGLKSVKAYMTYDQRLDDRALTKVLERTRDLGLILVVHAEDHAEITALRARFQAEGKLDPVWHARSRPPESEAKAVARVLELARRAGNAPVYIAHLSSAAGLAEARRARERGQSNIYLETCIQYLTFTEEEYRDPEKGLRYIMAPPLRGQGDVEALWQGLATGEIQVVASDHCAFTLSDKERGRGDFTRCPGGAPGLNERLPALFSLGLLAGRIDAQTFAAVSAAAPAEIFGLKNKGRLAPGADADLVLIDPAGQSEIYLPGPDSFSNYSGLGLKGRVEAVYLRGRRVAFNGVYTGPGEQGEFLGHADFD